MNDKILKFIFRPKVLLFSWLAFILSPLLSLIRIFFINSEIYHLSYLGGATTLLYYLPLIISVVTFVILIYWYKELVQHRLHAKHLRTLYFVSAASFFSLVETWLLLKKERLTYPNYLYEHYGLTVSQLELTFFIVATQLLVFVLILTLEYVSRYKNELLPDKPDKYHNKFSELSLTLTIIGISGLSVFSIQTKLDWSTLVGREGGNYETRVGAHFKYIDALSKCTGENVNIIHPPQGDKWPSVGNQPILRYFLFPRTLISGALFTDKEAPKNIREAYFVDIDPENLETHWPIINEKDKNIIFDEKTPIRYLDLEKVNCENKEEVYKVKL